MNGGIPHGKHTDAHSLVGKPAMDQFVARQSGFPLDLLIGCFLGGDLGVVDHQIQFLSWRTLGQKLVVGQRNDIAGKVRLKRYRFHTPT